MFVKNSANPKEIAMNNKSGNPDLTDNSLVHPEVALDIVTLLAMNHSGHSGRGQGERKQKTRVLCIRRSTY